MTVKVCGKHSLEMILNRLCFGGEYPNKLEFTVLSKEDTDECSLCEERAHFSFKIEYKIINHWYKTTELIEDGKYETPILKTLKEGEELK